MFGDFLVCYPFYPDWYKYRWENGWEHNHQHCQRSLSLCSKISRFFSSFSFCVSLLSIICFSFSLKNNPINSTNKMRHHCKTILQVCPFLRKFGGLLLIPPYSFTYSPGAGGLPEVGKEDLWGLVLLIHCGRK